MASSSPCPRRRSPPLRAEYREREVVGGQMKCSMARC
jgi:hypothetical protein